MRVSHLFGLSTREEAKPAPAAARETAIQVPARETQLPDAQAASLSSVYRAISIITTSVSQLPIYVERGGQKLEYALMPHVVKQPNLDTSRGDFISQLVTSMCFTGNAYFLASHDKQRGARANLTALDPREVSVTWNEKQKRINYAYRGKTYDKDRIGHARLLTLPGSAVGLSPIQAARNELTGAVKTRDYAAKHFDNMSHPSAILSSEQDLTEEDAKNIINAYNGLDEEGNPKPALNNPARVKVFSKGITYTPLALNPKDVQWIEARQFDTTSIARLFGVPASLMLAAVEGNSQTYANVEQEWISFARFTLTQYTRPIEDELTRMIPEGQRAKFNYEGLLRADTLTRYQSYALALDNGFMTVNEVRRLEERPELKESENE